MDVVRGAAVLLIIVFHATELMEGYGGLVPPPWLTDVNVVITPLRIPLLVLLSGMLLGASMRKGWRRYFSGKARNVAWPYVVWLVVWGAVSWPVYSVVGFALGGSYLWFLLYLLSFYVAAWVVRPVPVELVVLGAVVASGLAHGGPMDAERWPYLFAVFMVGHLLTRRTTVRTWVLGSPWALVLAGMLLLAHFGLSLDYGYGLGSSLFMLAGAILALRLARRTGSARALRPLRFVGRRSLVFYVSHYPVMAAVALGATAMGVSSVQLVLLILLASALSTATALAWFAHRAPVSWLFSAPARAPRVE